jgi:hypothetical protein
MGILRKTCFELSAHVANNVCTKMACFLVQLAYFLYLFFFVGVDYGYFYVILIFVCRFLYMPHVEMEYV